MGNPQVSYEVAPFDHGTRSYIVRRRMTAESGEVTYLDLERFNMQSEADAEKQARKLRDAVEGVTNFKPMLYMAYLGGDPSDGRFGEDHSTVLVVAITEAEAKSRARGRWTGEGRGHVDVIKCVDEVDRHDVALTPY